MNCPVCGSPCYSEWCATCDWTKHPEDTMASRAGASTNQELEDKTTQLMIGEA